MIATEGKAVYLIIKIADDGEFWSTSVTWYHNEEPIEEDYAHKIMADGSLVLCSVNWIIQDIYINEMDKFKCQQYWPDSGRKQSGPFHIIITDQQVFVDYAIRIFSVSVNHHNCRIGVLDSCTILISIG